MKHSYKAVLLIILYGLSGMTALAYEVLWTRMLSLLFGTTILGIVVTVAAFMLGLGLGSLLGSRFRLHLKYTLLALAGIEFGVALYALLLPSMMQALQGLWLGIDDLQVWQNWQIISAFCVLTLPALALGFAFPWMLRVGRAWDVSLGSLYGFNTLGGACGALLPLLLLPLLGWTMALQCVAGLGILLAAFLLCLSLLSSSDKDFMPSTEYQKSPTSLMLGLWAYAGLGAGALILEIAWARAYGMILLRTEYVLAVILAVFLLGIGLGSLLAQRLSRSYLLQWMPAMVGLAALFGLYAFPLLNDVLQGIPFDSLMNAMWVQGLSIAVCTLPATLALGAWLPLLSEKGDGARWYAVNSMGACVGAMLAGFVLIPYFGTASTWLIGAALVMLCGSYWIQKSKQRVCFMMIVIYALLAWPVMYLPDASRLLKAEFPGAQDMYQYEDAMSMTHVLQRVDGQRLLLADLQRMDASSDPTSVVIQKNQARLPLFLHGNPQSILFLGLGTGITASGALAWPDLAMDAVELSAGAVKAADVYFKASNDAVFNHLHVHQDDARRFLMRSDKQFDVIVGDLFHPDMVGRGSLLSVEQFARAQAHLNDGGVLVQWLALNQFDVDAMQLVLRSFAQVFPHNALFIDGYRLGLVGFKGGHQSAQKLIRGAPHEENWGGEGAWTWLGRYWGDVQTLLQGKMLGVKQGEWTPVIEYSLPNMRYDKNTLSQTLMWLLKQRISFESALDIWQLESDNERQLLKRAWASSTLLMRGQQASLHGDNSAMRLQALAYRANPKDRWAGFAVADAMFVSLQQGLPQGLSYAQALQKIMDIRADHEGALKAMMMLKQQQGDLKAAEIYQGRLKHISPYAKDL